jgi:hypothetical protein
LRSVTSPSLPSGVPPMANAAQMISGRAAITPKVIRVRRRSSCRTASTRSGRVAAGR